jgi:hypothetical protein
MTHTQVLPKVVLSVKRPDCERLRGAVQRSMPAEVRIGGVEKVA